MSANQIFSVPAAQPFLKNFAQWLHEQSGVSSIALSRWRVFVPSQRSRRALAEALLQASASKALLLPRISVLGDVEEESFLLESHVPDVLREAWLALPETVSRAEQSLQISRMLQHASEKAGRAISMVYAMQMARTLIPLLDECEREGVPLERLGRVVPQDYAEHWREQSHLLHVVAQDWPQWLDAQNKVSVIERRNREMALFTDYIRSFDTEVPIVAAGSTASVPATANLLHAIADRKNGYVVFPGLDSSDAAHQQHMHRWLATRDIKVENVELLCREKKAVLFSRICVANNSEQEAKAIALMLRETLHENETDTAACITYDAALTERVSVHLRAAGITACFSAGTALQDSYAGRVVRLLLECVEQSFAPVALAALLKHSAIRTGFSKTEYHAAITSLELHCLRGRRRYRSLKQLQSLAQRTIIDADHATIINAIFTHMQPLDAAIRKGKISLLELVETLCESLTHLTTDALGNGLFAEHEGGREVHLSLQRLVGSMHASMQVNTRESSRIIADWLSHDSLRPISQKGQRVFLLTPQEARLLPFDRIVIAGMNEGHWPPSSRQHVWLNKGMRMQLGLSADVNKEVLASHDFYQLVGLPNNIITYSKAVSGSPAQPAKVLQHYMYEKEGELPQAQHYTQWAEPECLMASDVAPPKPVPKQSARPHEFSPTSVEQLIRDPYGYYAKYILSLRAFEPLDRDTDVALFGDLVHRALERWVKGSSEERLDQVRLEKIGYQLFSQHFHEPQVEKLWWPRFQKLAEAFIAHVSQDERWLDATISAEISYEKEIRIGERHVWLKARLDRSDANENSCRIIDYKTGAMPSVTEVKQGWSPQLLLQWLACADYYENNPNVELSYWKTSGGREALVLQENLNQKSDTILQYIADGFTALLGHYLLHDTPYLAQPVENKAPRYNDYAYVERKADWG